MKQPRRRTEVRVRVEKDHAQDKTQSQEWSTRPQGTGELCTQPGHILRPGSTTREVPAGDSRAC